MCQFYNIIALVLLLKLNVNTQCEFVARTHDSEKIWYCNSYMYYTCTHAHTISRANKCSAILIIIFQSLISKITKKKEKHMTKLRFYLNVTHRHEKNKIQFDVLEHLRSIEKNDNPFRMFCLSSVYSTFVVRSIFAAYQKNLFKNNQFLDDHYDGRDKLDYGRFADDLFDCNCAGIDSALAFFGRVLQIKESYTRHFNNIVNNTNVKWYIPFFLSVVQNLNAL